jgi:hypothetical protein
VGVALALTTPFTNRQGGARTDWFRTSPGWARKHPLNDPGWMLQLRTATAIVTDAAGPEEPIRAELFGIERLEEHAESLAAAHHSAEKSLKGRNRD